MKKYFGILLIILFMIGANDFIETNYDDDVSITFGTSTAFKQKYDSGDTRLEILDGADNVMAHIEDGGTTGTLTMTGGVTTDTLSITAGAIISGTYTPTVTAVANGGTFTSNVFQYMRVGNVVTVSGRIDHINCTANTTLTRFRFTLPIASNLANVRDCVGSSFNTSTGIDKNGGIIADVTNDEAECKYESDAAASTNTRLLMIHFTYQII